MAHDLTGAAGSRLALGWICAFVSCLLAPGSPAQEKPATRRQIPALLQALVDQDRLKSQGARQELLARWEEALDPLLAVLETEDRILKAEVIAILRQLGAKAAPRTVPALIRVLRDPNRKEIELRDLHKKELARPAQDAAIALGDLAPFAPGSIDEARTAMEVELRDRNGWHLTGIRRAWFRLQLDPGASVHQLIGGLEDPVPYVREYAAEALGRMGPQAREAIKSLARALEEKHPTTVSLRLGGFGGSSSARLDPEIHRQAALAMLKISPHDQESIPAHIYFLRDGRDPAQLLRSVMAVGMHGSAGKAAVKPLLALFKNSNPRLVAEAITALGMIGDARAEVIEALEEASKHEEKAVSARAVATIKLLQRQGLMPRR